MKINETNFVRQLQLHNEKALDYVIAKYGALLMAVIRRHLYRFPQLQEECMNDVLLSIWQHIDTFDPDGNSFSNWAAAIARFRSIDYLRKYRKELQNVSWNALDPQQGDFGVSGDLEQSADGEYSAELQAMLQCLKPIDQELFRRLYVEEESMEQISKELRMDRSVIYNRLSRARKKMLKISGKIGRI